MILGIDHIGVATDRATEAGQQLASIGLVRLDHGPAVDYGVDCEFWVVPGLPSVSIELVSPVVETSVVSGRLEDRGPGPYHIALRVDDLEAEVRRLRDSGFLALDDRPCQGARAAMRVSFLYLPEPAELLVELVHYGYDPTQEHFNPIE